MAAKPALWGAVVAVLGVVADVATKGWAPSRLSHGRDITMTGRLDSPPQKREVKSVNPSQANSGRATN